MEGKETLRLIVASPLILSLSFFLVYWAVRWPGTQNEAALTVVEAERIKAESELALLELRIKTAAGTKDAAFTEFDKCRNEAQASYLQRWEDACKSHGLGPECTLEKDGPGLNNNFKEQKEDCKQRFDMRTQP